MADVRRVALLLPLLLLPSEEAAPSGDPWDPPPTVRRIQLERVPIFDEADRERLPWLPLGLVNRLHVTTREGVIRRELLFEPGTPLDPETLDESERKLRSTGFFADATILPVFVSRDSVDVVVRTREIWTTELTFNYERFEEQVAWSVLLRESNFLGMAKSLDLARSVDEDRGTWSLGLSDRQLFDGLWRGGFTLSDSDDGPGSSWHLRRPFESVAAFASGGANYYHFGQRPRFYLNGAQYVRPYADATGWDLEFLRRISISESQVIRTGLGIHVYRRDFHRAADLAVYDATGETPLRRAVGDELRESRRTHVLSLVLESAPRRYLKRRFQYSMGNVEDIPLGHRARVEVGWAAGVFDATHAGMNLFWQHAWTRQFGPSLLTAHAGATGFWPRTESVIDLRAGAAVASYTRLRPDLTLAIGARSATGSNLDRHQVYTLGIDNGLRAARFKEFAGDRLLRMNAELRWVHRDGLAGLLIPGLVGFMDVGHSWFEGERDLLWEDIRGAVGVGLRLGFARSSQRLPVRVDLGWPVLYDNERPGAILSIGTGHVF